MCAPAFQHYVVWHCWLATYLQIPAIATELLKKLKYSMLCILLRITNVWLQNCVCMWYYMLFICIMCIIYVEIQIPYTCRCVYTIICMFSQQTLYKLDIICYVHNYACRHVCSSLPIEVLADFLCTCTVCHPVVCWQGGRNALHLSAQGGHLEVIRFLSPRFGAKVHDRTDAGYTILHWAAQKGHSQVARYLIKELNRNPKDRDKVCGVQGKMCSTVLGLHASCMCVCYFAQWDMQQSGHTWHVHVMWYPKAVLCYVFRVLSGLWQLVLVW